MLQDPTTTLNLFLPLPACELSNYQCKLLPLGYVKTNKQKHKAKLNLFSYNTVQHATGEKRYRPIRVSALFTQHLTDMNMTM